MSYPVIISYSNDGYFGFARNMLLSLDHTLTHHQVHFYCLDTDIYDKLRQIPFQQLKVTFEVWTEPALSKRFEKYGSAEYNKITHTKMNILRDALTKFNFIHFIDSDVVCLKEPTLEHYANYADRDIVFQHDAGMYTKDRLHAPTLHHIWACTGNTTFRNTPGTHAVLDKITEYQIRYPNKNDQECLYQYFQDLKLTDIRNYTAAKLYTYEVAEYTNGYWLDNKIGTLDQTYFFHANHVEGSAAKIHLLRKAGQWFV